MTLRVALATLVSLLAAGALAAAVVLGLNSSGAEPAPSQLESDEAISVTTTLSPPIHRLGDLVVATLELTVDSRVIAPELIEVRAQFGPYEAASEVEISRRSTERFVELHYSYELQCVAADCVSEDSPATIELPQALVSYLRSDTNRGVDLPTAWPVATLVGRAGDRAGSVPAEATLGELPATSYAVDPDLLRGLAIALVALLLAAVAGWAVLRLRPRWGRGVATIDAPAAADTLGRALSHLGDARAQSPAAQRLALETLAVELDALNGQELAPIARRLAWSEAPPAEAELDSLVAAATKLEHRA